MTDETHDAATADTRPVSTLALTTRIVAAYVGKNPMPGTELPALIDTVFQSLASVATGSGAAVPEASRTPAVPVKKSVFADHIVCLEDGKKMKMLKRHLMTSYNLTPDAYRARWGLPPDYPMVAPSYAEKRSTLAKSIGLGRKPASPAAHTTEPQPQGQAELEAEEQVAPIPKTRGRKLAKAAEAHEE